MNFPVGDIVGKGECPFDLVSTSGALGQKRFSGYIILSVRGHFVEEGALFFRDGEISGCVVECLGAGAVVKGFEAFKLFAGESVGLGFFQVVGLTKSQVDLVLAFDEKLLTGKIDLKDIPKLIPSAFVPFFTKVAESKSALDLYGLGGLKQ